jgi:hypothetical protein
MSQKPNGQNALRAEAETKLARAISARDEAPHRPAEELLHELQVNKIELPRAAAGH